MKASEFHQRAIDAHQIPKTDIRDSRGNLIRAPKRNLASPQRVIWIITIAILAAPIVIATIWLFGVLTGMVILLVLFSRTKPR